MAATSVDLIDLVFTGNLVNWVNDVIEERVTFDYSILLRELNYIRENNGYRRSDGVFAPAAIDLMSKRQSKFTEALHHRGIHVERIDYHHAYVSRPVEKDVIYKESTPLSVSTTLAFLLGRLAERRNTKKERPEVLIVTGAFDLYVPLRQFVEGCQGRAGIVYFRQLLDSRWKEVFNNDQPIEFYDLTPVSEEITGVDLRKILDTDQRKPEEGFWEF